MSASREKKARQELGADYVSPKEQKAREEAKAARRSTAIFTVCAVLFLVFVIGMAVYKSGVIQRKAAAVRVGDTTYSAEDMSYYYYTTRSNVLNSLSSLIDTSTSLRKQDSFTEGKTWFDYVAESAASNLASATLTAKAAAAAGYDGGEELETSFNETISSFEDSASQSGYTASQYLKAVYGPLMSRAGFERSLRTVLLAESYANSLSDASAYSEAELAAKRDSDPDAYDAVAVRHILVDDEETANSLLEQWKNGDATEESFGELAKENTTDTGSADNGGLYEDVLKGQMVEEFEDWCFDSARQSGDTGIVQSTYGYHVMYFVSRGLYSDWQSLAASSIASDKIASFTEGVEPELLDGMKYIDN